MKKSYYHNESDTQFCGSPVNMAPHKQFGESRFVNGSKTPCGVIFISKRRHIWIRLRVSLKKDGGLYQF